MRQRRDAEHAADHVGVGRRRPRPIIIAIATRATEHGQHHQQLLPAPAGGLRDLRRRLDEQLAAGDLGRGPARPPAHQHRRHCALPSR